MFSKTISSTTELQFDTDVVIYEEGDSPDFAYFIEEGELLLYQDRDGVRKTLERRGPGSMLGELSVLTNQPRTVGALTTKPCKIFKISASQISNHFKQIDPILRACVETSFRFVKRLNEKDATGPEVPLAETVLSDATSLIERFKMENAIKKGLESQQFYMNYQPILDTQTQQIIGFESLMRWQHPTLGFVPPDSFIPVAEKMGAIFDLTNLALFESCATLRQLELEFPMAKTMFVTVNASGQDFMRSDFLDYISHVLDLNELQPERLRLEVTETALVPNCDMARDTFLSIRKLGCGISVDDFGKGYSNLAYLKDLPITAIKIDRAFVGDASTNTASHAIVKMVTALGKDLGVQIVGEGVETPADLEVLSNLKCDLAQGYLFSKPVCKDALFELIAPSAKTARSVA